MEKGSHQAQGLQRLFSASPELHVVSVLSAPRAPASHEFVLALADALSSHDRLVCLVETGKGQLSAKLGCRPLLSWQSGRSLDAQVLSARGHGLLYAPDCAAGDAAITNEFQANGSFDFLLFDGGYFSPIEAPIEPATVQTLVVLLGKEDAEAGFALIKALKDLRSPARILLIGEVADRVAQVANHFMIGGIESLKTGGDLYQISNMRQETSSNTLTIAPNLTWVVSRITKNDQPKVAHGGIGKSAKEV